MKVYFDHTEPVALNINTFWFRPHSPFRYTAGQYIEMYLPHDTPDNRGVKRWFTLSSSPLNPLISITTKLTPGGSSFKNTLQAVQPGTMINISEPMGDFVLPKDPTIPLVFAAGGIGITPMHSMIQWLHDSGERRQIKLLYAVTRQEELAFESLFKDTSHLTFIPVIGEPPKHWAGLTGRLSADLILKTADHDPKALIYVSGPEPMTESLEADLKAQGIAPEQLVLDFFPGYPI